MNPWWLALIVPASVLVGAVVIAGWVYLSWWNHWNSR